MSSVDETLHGFPDLFCELYDAIDIQYFKTNVESLLTDADLLSLTTAIAFDVEQARAVPGHIRMRVNNSSDPERQRFACLRGLDRAFAHVNPALRAAGTLPAGLERLALTVAANQRLDSGAQGGALLPRLISPARHSALPEHPRELFRSVIRVPDSAWRACSHHVMGEAALLHRHEILAGIPVACLPFIEDPGELHFNTETRPAGRFYRIGPTGDPATRARTAAAVAELDRSNTMIALVPELTLSPEILADWQTALRDPRRRPGRLHWILVGTGSLDGEHPPRNTAVLLNARSGEIISMQDKLYGFTLSGEELTRWKLTGRLGKEPIAEDLRPGEQLIILDAGGIRVATLVCEDLGRVVDLAGHIRDFGVSHLLVPVFARPSQDRRWERAAADVHARATGSTIVVANSLVMASILGADAKSGGTGLVVWPGDEGALLLSSPRAHVPACFSLLPDGSAVAT